MKLYLDDIRVPDGDWVIVRSYNEFISHIKQYGLPEFISFDHDLADEHYAGENYKNFKEKTGLDCARWLLVYCT